MLASSERHAASGIITVNSISYQFLIFVSHFLSRRFDEGLQEGLRLL
jgi:hypothetical protein